MEAVVKIGERLRDVVLLALEMEEGAISQQIQLISASGKCQRNGFTARVSWKLLSPVDVLILALEDSFWTSDIQNCKIISLCCFKPLSKFVVVTAAVGNSFHTKSSFSCVWCLHI